MADPDWADPCEVLAWIRKHYYKVAAGVQEIRIVYRGRDTQYSQAKLSDLAELMARLEADCNTKNGVAPSRRAIIAG